MELARLRAENARFEDGARHRKKSRGVLRAGHAAGVRLDSPNERAVSGQPGLRGAGSQRQRVFQLACAGARPAAVAVRRHSDEALLASHPPIHAEVKGEYGWPRMHKELLARGIRWQNRVRKLMKQHGIRPRPNASSW